MIIPDNFKVSNTQDYLCGYGNNAFVVKVKEYKNRDNYFYMILDGETDDYIISNIVSSSTANDIENMVSSSFYRSDKYESCYDIYLKLTEGFYGSFFKYGKNEKEN